MTIIARSLSLRVTLYVFFVSIVISEAFLLLERRPSSTRNPQRATDACHEKSLVPQTSRKISGITSPLQSTGSDIVITEPLLSIEGLVLSDEEVQKRNDVHNLLQELQREIPLLLTRPLSEDAAEQTYTADVKLTVGENNKELSSSREELINLNQALVLASTATVQAATFLQRNRTQATESSTTAPMVNCRLGLNANMTSVTVQWTVEDPPTSGESVLELDPETRKIANHRLIKVRFNGQEQDASSIGDFLSTTRQAFLGIQESPFFQPLLSFSSIFDQVRDEWMAQQLSKPPMENYPLPSVFVITNKVSSTNLTWIPVDKYTNREDNGDRAPFPGSKEWAAYAKKHIAYSSFASQVIPALSGNGDNSDLHDYFTANAKLYATDGSLLLKGADRLARFYQSLATVRERSLQSTFVCDRLEVVDFSNLMVQLEYTATFPLPGRTTPLLFRGKDSFSLQLPRDTAGTPLIEQVRQVKFTAGENTPQTDGVVLMRSLAAAIETGQFQSPMEYSSFLMDLLQLSPPVKSKSREILPRSKPQRSDAAGLVTFRIMESLHREIQELFCNEKSNKSLDPPASAFLAENVILTGYLEETLLRGRVAYNRNIGVALNTLRVGVRSGNIVSEKEPSVRVELTAEGNIRCSIKVFLKLKAPIPGLALADSKSAGVPLQLGLLSEYDLDPASGKILQHKLLESRINGSLTPGDVVSRWIRRVPPIPDDEASNTDDFVMQTILDTVNWVRSFRNE